MSSLRDNLLKATSLEYTGILSDSVVYNTRDFAPTSVAMINVALSADPFGGVSSGLTSWCGPSRHFKSLFCLLSAKAYLDKYPDAFLLMYDSEFGTPPSYFRSAGIDPERVIHVPITTYEELKSDISKKLDVIKRGDRVIIVVDSLGNLASKKESEDAKKDNDAADFTRSKQNKSLFRIVTPHLGLKNIPMHVVQHTYDTMEMFSKKVVAGGQGTMLASDNVFILGRQQDKEGTGATAERTGYNFIINVEKSRYVKEKAKIPITVSFKGGVKRWSGLFDIAIEGGYAEKVSAQLYRFVDPSTGEVIQFEKDAYKRKDCEDNAVIWKKMLSDTSFTDYIKQTFAVSHGNLIQDDETIDDVVDDEE